MVIGVVAIYQPFTAYEPVIVAPTVGDSIYDLYVVDAIALLTVICLAVVLLLPSSPYALTVIVWLPFVYFVVSNAYVNPALSVSYAGYALVTLGFANLVAVPTTLLSTNTSTLVIGVVAIYQPFTAHEPLTVAEAIGFSIADLYSIGRLVTVT